MKISSPLKISMLLISAFFVQSKSVEAAAFLSDKIPPRADYKTEVSVYKIKHMSLGVLGNEIIGRFKNSKKNPCSINVPDEGGRHLKNNAQSWFDANSVSCLARIGGSTWATPEEILGFNTVGGAKISQVEFKIYDGIVYYISIRANYGPGIDNFKIQDVYQYGDNLVEKYGKPSSLQIIKPEQNKGNLAETIVWENPAEKMTFLIGTNEWNGTQLVGSYVNISLFNKNILQLFEKDRDAEILRRENVKQQKMNQQLNKARGDI